MHFEAQNNEHIIILKHHRDMIGTQLDGLIYGYVLRHNGYRHIIVWATYVYSVLGHILRLIWPHGTYNGAHTCILST